jgi:acetylornithine deacetylase/succinyl-diaminopimelate desuccinylase-like protein
MSYAVSPKTQELLDKILSFDEVQKTLEFIKEDSENTLQNQIDLVKIEAPTFHEEERAKAYAKYFEELGLENVHLDQFGNTIGEKRGTGGGPKVLVEAHLDTVFPFGSVKDVRIENGIVYAPGICDDTRGLAVNLSVIRALNHSGLKLKGDFLFAGSVEEEGLGGLSGVKKLLQANQDIEASINIDGFEATAITYQATGMRTCEANFYGIGGHAYGAFGTMANPLHAAARAVAKIADIEVPEDPRTTFCVSNFHAGNDAGIHAIVQKATIKFNFRSNSMEELNKLNDKIMQALQEACDEETKRWGKDTITFDYNVYVDVPAGDQDKHAPIVESTYAIMKHYLGHEPIFNQGGSTNANNPIGAGIPAVCVGLGTTDNKVHSLEEFFPTENSHELVQLTFLLALMLGGIEGKTESILNL